MINKELGIDHLLNLIGNFCQKSNDIILLFFCKSIFNFYVKKLILPWNIAIFVMKCKQNVAKCIQNEKKMYTICNKMELNIKMKQNHTCKHFSQDNSYNNKLL